MTYGTPRLLEAPIYIMWGQPDTIISAHSENYSTLF
jgi:hypothetical protein